MVVRDQDLPPAGSASDAEGVWKSRIRLPAAPPMFGMHEKLDEVTRKKVEPVEESPQEQSLSIPTPTPRPTRAASPEPSELKRSREDRESTDSPAEQILFGGAEAAMPRLSSTATTSSCSTQEEARPSKRERVAPIEKEEEDDSQSEAESRDDARSEDEELPEVAKSALATQQSQGAYADAQPSTMVREGPTVSTSLTLDLRAATQFAADIGTPRAGQVASALASEKLDALRPSLEEGQHGVMKDARARAIERVASITVAMCQCGKVHCVLCAARLKNTHTRDAPFPRAEQRKPREARAGGPAQC